MTRFLHLMEIKNLIKTRRQELGLSMEELGRRIGVSKQTIHKWEYGKISNLKQSSIVALSKALEISLDELLGMDPLPPQEPKSTAEDVQEAKELMGVDVTPAELDQIKGEIRASEPIDQLLNGQGYTPMYTEGFPGRVWAIIDQRSGKAYQISERDSVELYASVEAFAKFQVFQLLQRCPLVTDPEMLEHIRQENAEE